MFRNVETSCFSAVGVFTHKYVSLKAVLTFKIVLR